MAKKPKAVKRADLDLPEGWEAHEEEVKEKKKGRELKVSNWVFWLLFILIFLAFLALPLFGKPTTQKPTETTYVNGIKITGPGDPLEAVKSLSLRHIIGKTLDKSEDSSNALLEIGTIIGQSRVLTGGGDYTMAVGISDRTGIFIGQKSATVEGAKASDLWAAVWTFNSILSDTTIEADRELYLVQHLLRDRENVSLVIDLDKSCTNYPSIISASGDIMQSLGFRQAEVGFTINQYNETNGACWLQFAAKADGNATNSTPVADCPQSSEKDFVITLVRGEKNVIRVAANSLDFQYSNCESLASVSVIVRDMLAPYVLSGARRVDFPVEV